MIDNYKYTEAYQQISGGTRTTRGMLRHGVLNLLSGFNPILKTKTPRIQFLYFHHVFEDEIKGLDKLLKTLSK